MLVEDEALVALRQRKLLEQAGYRVATAQSGEAAVETVDTDGTINLILMDIGLGAGMDGTQAAQTILANHSLPIVFLTNRDDQEHVEQAEQITRYGYVLKSSGDRVLLQALRMAFELFDAHRELTAQENRLHQIIDDAPIGIYESWETGSFRSMNREMARLLGFDGVEAAMTHYRDLANEFYVDAARRKELFETLERDGIVQDFQLDAVNAAGRRLTLRTNARVLMRGPEGGMLVSGFLVDETRRRKAEAALSSSLEQYRSVVRLAQEIIVRSDAEGVWTFVNNEACRFFGMQREELVGRRFLDFVHPDDHPETRASERTMRDSRRSVEGLVNRQWTPRGWRYVEWNAAPILDDNGTFMGLQSTGRDISDQRRMQEQWRALFEQATVGVLLSSGEQMVVQANPYAAQILGYAPAELVQLSSADLVHPEDLARESPAEARARMEESGEQLQRELRLRRKDGRYIHALVSMKRFHSLRDDVRYVFMFYDISERIEAERRLREALDEKDSLMAELNHRVKNNLAMVSSLISLKDASLGNDVDLSDIVQHIEAIRSVYDMLHRSDSITEVSIHSYMQELLESTFNAKAGEPVQIENDVADIAVPAKSATVLGLIVNELAINAMKYGFTADTSPRFRIELCEESGVAQVGAESERRRRFACVVSNNGRPFPEDVPLDNPETLGLQLVSGLVSQLDGSLELERRPQTRFTIRFSL